MFFYHPSGNHDLWPDHCNLQSRCSWCPTSKVLIIVLGISTFCTFVISHSPAHSPVTPNLKFEDGQFHHSSDSDVLPPSFQVIPHHFNFWVCFSMTKMSSTVVWSSQSALIAVLSLAWLSSLWGWLFLLRLKTNLKFEDGQFHHSGDSSALPLSFQD